MMNILTYRGPNNPGGVSSAISRIVEANPAGRIEWWYVSQSALVHSSRQSSSYTCRIPDALLDGHYRHCNNFLWPVMHDLPQYALYSAADREAYEKVNLAIAGNFLNERKRVECDSLFVQDYQFAFVPSLISFESNIDSSLFWHIPWPEHVAAQHIPAVSEVAAGMLGATVIGFHTECYVRNFLRFVEKDLPECEVDYVQNCVISKGDDGGYHTTQVIAKPLGLNARFWKEELNRWTTSERKGLIRDFASVPYILSVDRADYTKGVYQRLQAIDHFFDTETQFRGQITFLQLCQRTRNGLPMFDRYWDQCRNLVERINSRWCKSSWEPIVWIDKPIPPAVLSVLYSGAQAMLITPVRDGLNLTAKEFVACAGSAGGTLLLSEGAGVYQELGEYAIKASSRNPQEITSAIKVGMQMPLSERQNRMFALKQCLKSNSLSEWWQTFVAAEDYGLCDSNKDERVPLLLGRDMRATADDVAALLP